MTRKKMTAFTFTVTLSLVTTSCGGTSRLARRSEIRTMRSIGRKTRISPGPFGCGKTRPRRKTTARSYSERILMEVSAYRIRIRTTVTGNSMKSPSSDRFDFQLESFQLQDTNRCAVGRGTRADSIPVFAVHQNFAGRSEIGDRHAGLIDHAG